VLQQHHAHLNIKRAASGIMDGHHLLHHCGGGTKKHSGSASGMSAGSGGAGCDGASGSEASALSGSGLRRAVLSLKSVKAVPLSAAAKASVINTIADNALAAFVVVQV
jgi:hypothetical protein